jgi:hypothetical protein
MKKQPSVGWVEARSRIVPVGSSDAISIGIVEH